MNLTEQNFEHSKVLGEIFLASAIFFIYHVSVGKGKFGIVTLSLCIETNSFVAVKHIPKEIIFEAKAASRIRQEIDIASMVSHPFIVPYFGEYTASIVGACCICVTLFVSLTVLSADRGQRVHGVAVLSRRRTVHAHEKDR